MNLLDHLTCGTEVDMNEHEIRRFRYESTVPTHDMLAIIELNDSGVPSTIHHEVPGVKVKFRDLPLLTFFWAQESDKVYYNGFYVKITTREGLLLKDLLGETVTHNERVRFSPEYRVVPQSAQIILEPAKPEWSRPHP